MTHFWHQKRFYKRQKQTTRLLGHQTTIATNGDSSVSSMPCTAVDYFGSNLCSLLLTSPQFMCNLPLKKQKIVSNRKRMLH